MVFSRNEANQWVYSSVSGLESSLDLPSIGCTLALSDVYEQVNLNTHDRD